MPVISPKPIVALALAFLKEHRTVNDLKATVAQQQKQLEAVTAALQKVSAKLELNRAGPQTALNDK